MQVSSIHTNLTKYAGKTESTAKDISSSSSIDELKALLEANTLSSNAGAMLLNSLDVIAKKTNLSSNISLQLKSGERPDLLSGYGENASSGNSRYVDATLNSLKTSQRLKNSKDDDLFALVNQFGGINVSGTYYPNDDAGSEAEIKAAVKRQGSQEIIKNADEDFKDARDAAEQQAAQDAAPKDAMGNPILIGVGAGSESAGTDTAAATPVVAGGADAAAAAPVPTGDAAATADASSSADQATAQNVAAFQVASGGGDAPKTEGAVDIVV